jgi:SAM-dependent methyltransferase
MEYILPQIKTGKILDYGCGSGFFVSEINKIQPNCAIGYEPFMEERCGENLPVYSNYPDILQYAPYKVITILEVLEHLQWSEIASILNRCNDELLSSDGIIIISVPITIGPALLLKELNLFRITGKWHYNILEFIGALFFGNAGYRDNPDLAFMSDHKGFDFRELIRFIRSKDWQVKILGYTPLPINWWYGNSQIFFSVRK